MHPPSAACGIGAPPRASWRGRIARFSLCRALRRGVRGGCQRKRNLQRTPWPIDETDSFNAREALFYHETIRPGKIEIIASKPMATQRDLSLAYSPGVAVPVQAIADDPANAARYTARSNLVAVISNGTAILGMGNLGALASKPVMEGKAVLFKRFADVDSIDIELATEDPEAFVNAVALMEPTFGGINLEDIAAPECFVIEQALRERMNIPVMHDDQHGTAIISAAGLLNACYLTGRELKDVQDGGQRRRRLGDRLHRADQGDGRAARQRDDVRPLGRDLPRPRQRRPVEERARDRHRQRARSRRRWSAPTCSSASRLPARSSPNGSAKMADQPIIFAMANPDPEITPDDAKAVRPDAIVATGRSDYPNQVNNVLGFPFIFRGALDVQATAINEEMKIAAAQAIAELARQPVPEEVAAAYGKRHQFGRDYIIPAPFDPRLMEVVSSAVAKAAMDSGVAQAPIADFDAYRHQLKSRLNPTTSVLTSVYAEAKSNPKRVIFAEARGGSRAARGDPVPRLRLRHAGAGRPHPGGCATSSPGSASADAGGVRDPELGRSELVPQMVAYLYERLQRRGYTERDVRRMVNQDRNTFASLLLALGHGDAMISGITRPFAQTMREVSRVIDPKPGQVPFGIHLMIGKNYTVFLADTTINERPSAPELAHIAKETAAVARRLGHEPRVAFLGVFDLRQPVGQVAREHPRRGAPARRRGSRVRVRGRDGARRGAQSRGHGALPVQPPVGAGQRAGHARAAVGQPLGQAAARARRQRHDRADADRDGKAGPDRPDDRHRRPTC